MSEDKSILIVENAGSVLPLIGIMFLRKKYGYKKKQYSRNVKEREYDIIHQEIMEI
jgi:hypothetical protein